MQRISFLGLLIFVIFCISIAGVLINGIYLWELFLYREDILISLAIVFFVFGAAFIRESYRSKRLVIQGRLFIFLAGYYCFVGSTAAIALYVRPTPELFFTIFPLYIALFFGGLLLSVIFYNKAKPKKQSTFIRDIPKKGYEVTPLENVVKD